MLFEISTYFFYHFDYLVKYLWVPVFIFLEVTFYSKEECREDIVTVNYGTFAEYEAELATRFVIAISECVGKIDNQIIWVDSKQE